MIKRSLIGTVALSMVHASLAVDSAPSPESVKAIVGRVADWQIKTFEDQQAYRAISSSNQKKLEEAQGDPDVKLDQYVKSFMYKWHDLEWHNAALYAGMNEWRKVADDGAAQSMRTGCVRSASAMRGNRIRGNTMPMIMRSGISISGSMRISTIRK